MSKKLQQLIKRYLKKAYELGDLTLQMHNVAVVENCVDEMHEQLSKEPGMLETYMATNKIEL